MRIPLSTYRVQFNRLFDFSACGGIAQYLHDLGITDLYASPIFKARKGSMHGYDVVEHNEFNPELGSENDFRSLAARLRSLSIGWLQDIVPNHMAFDSENTLLMDVLENGTHSRYFNYFDIEWDHPYDTLKGRLLVPLLGSFYSEALENSEISLRYDEQGLYIRYYDLKLPLKLGSYGKVFGRRINELEENHANSPDFISFLGALRIFEPLSVLDNNAERHYDQIKHAKRILWDFYNRNPQVREFMDANISYFNGRGGDPASFNPLDELLSEQSFRLSFWKVATEEINYRRFFTINELISLRIEDEPVMEQAHRLVFALIKSGIITGLRIDHIDGLYDPRAYLSAIRERIGSVYMVVEKILAEGERLPEEWEVQGTTGYDFMSILTGLFCRKSGENALSDFYRRFTGLHEPFETLVVNKKRLIIGKYMAGNIDNLAGLMKRISANDRYGRDITMYGLKRALVELAAFFPVYRTYIDESGISGRDREYINHAHAKAGAAGPGLAYEMDFIRKFLLRPFAERTSPAERKRLCDFVMRFQQFTAPIMAKGFEDTVLYVYNRLISLNEVGGCPSRFGFTADEYHAFCRARQAHDAFSFNASATHDTKRGEDVRSRISVLSELAQEWSVRVAEWNAMNRAEKGAGGNRDAPDSNDEYFLYQTLVGAFPFEESERPGFLERMKRYVVKAVREAKVHTAWIKPDVEYERACIAFVEKLLAPSADNRFLEDFIKFQRKIAFYGVFNSLSQVLLKCTSPGIPDFYQGTELWDFCLVDPDNRSPVDFTRRQALLGEIMRRREEPGYLRRLLDARHTGAVKLFVVHACLQARTQHPEVFLKGSYLPLQVEGRFRENIIAYCRENGGRWFIAAAPLYLTSLVQEGEYPLGEVWQDTALVLAPGAPVEWRNAFSGAGLRADGALPVRTLFEDFPLGLAVSV